MGSRSSKRRKEESTVKKVREDGDRIAADLRTRDSSAAADANRVGSDEGVAEVKNENSSVANGEGMEYSGKPKPVVVVKPCTKPSNEEGLKQDASSEMPVKVEKADENNGSFSKIEDSNVTQKGNNALAYESTKVEDVNKAVHGRRQPKDESHFEGDLNVGSCHVVIDKEDPRAVIDHPSVPDMHDIPDSDGPLSLTSKLQEFDVKIDTTDAQGFENTKLLLCLASDEIPHSANQLPHFHQKSSGHSSDILPVHQTVTSLSSNEHKSRDNEKEVVFSNQVYDKTTEGQQTGVSEIKQHGQVMEESPSCATVEKSLLEEAHVSRIVGEPTKYGDSNLCEVPPSSHKLVVAAGKVSSTSFAPVISRPSVSSSHKSLVSTASSTDGKATQSSKHRVKVTSLTSGKKDIAGTVSSTEESVREVSRHPVKGHSKGLDCHGSKSSQLSRIARSSDSKHVVSDSKEPFVGPSSKTSTSMNINVAISTEAVGSSQTQNASIQLPSGSCQKSEKLNQPLPLPPSKLLNNSSSTHPPPCATVTTLSDEELALLLHQELNSSPRVPRVPRVRQATSLQLAFPTAPSMLSKRSSSHSGAKDQVFRRKNKEEAPKDISRNSHKVNETKRVVRVSSSPDRKYRESAFVTDGSSKKDIPNRSPDSGVSLRKNISSGTCDEGETRFQPSFEATGHNTLSKRSSPRDLADGGTSVITRTLPVLLDEILSKGNCSTYEELCDSVRPHWNNLRKPNGDRYAYSSHSHAVLDCLRNRSEWAHLIDRGPKTNSSKRRKLDSGLEESEYEDGKKASSKEVADINGEAHREEFPKGKRNVRKRRRLELRGQDMEEAQKRKHNSSQSAPTVSDGDNNDDPAAVFSQSSNSACDDDELSSEESHGGGDLSHGGGDLAAGEELSTSSRSGDTDDS
ncbi:uncharacterized protein M6B38_147065 [Iris pallida]|uniref:DUF7648 domain-containing protein n=1 Tax=Iris pallida TaxID=29817 RepID=A0AAX6F960_IRIPA|nr:uncharacterized protein M6B38_147065 [Iris pallida]